MPTDVRKIRRRFLLRAGLLALGLPCLNGSGCGDEKYARVPGLPATVEVPALPTLTLGSVLVLSGPNSHYGEDTKAGMEIGLDVVNARGVVAANGEGKFRLAVRFSNSLGGPNNTLNASEVMQEFIAAGSPAVLGAFLSGETLALAPIANERHVVLLSPCSTSHKLREAGPWVFRILPTDQEQAVRMADYARVSLKADRASILNIDNAYGQELADAFHSRFVGGGKRVVYRKQFGEGTREFAGFVNGLLDSDAEFLFLVGHTQEMVDLLRTKRRMEGRGRRTIPVLGTDGMYDDVFLSDAGEAAEGVVLASAGFNRDQDDEVVRDFVGRYRSRFKREPNIWGAGGFDSILVIAEAIRKGGISPEGIRRGMTEIRGLRGATGINTVDPTGGMEGKAIYSLKVLDGKFVECTQRP